MQAQRSAHLVGFIEQYDQSATEAEQRLRRVIGVDFFDLRWAVYHVDDNPESSLNHSRKVLEYILRYMDNQINGTANNRPLNALVEDRNIKTLTPTRIHTMMENAKNWGDVGSHAGGMPTEEDAQDAARYVMTVTSWFLSTFEERESSSSDADDTKHLSLALCQGLQALNKHIKTVTEEQFQVLEFLRTNRRVSICGCAGSGKTLLAMEKASRLDRAGLKTLVLCHNPYLAEFIRESLRHTNVRVEAFCQWIRSLTADVSREESWSHFDEPTSEQLDTAFDMLHSVGTRYDAVIVDEAQDFADDWWLVTEASLENRTAGHFYIFYDNNQALLPLRSRYPVTESPVSLQVNCRNSQEIATALSVLAKDAKPDNRLTGGSFTCTRYAKGEEDRGLRSAFSTILTSGIWESICVVTTEPGVPSDSILAGRVVVVPPSCRWQDVVENLLRRRKGVYPREAFPTLGNGTRPTSKDIENIVMFAKRIRVVGPPANKKIVGAMRWERPRWGQLCLSGPNHLPQHAVDFFTSMDWANTLPRDRKLTLVPFDRKLGPNDVALHNASSIKGLEADAVVTFASVPRPELRAATYVALSRARLHQHLLISMEAAEYLPLLNFTNRPS